MQEGIYFLASFLPNFEATKPPPARLAEPRLAESRSAAAGVTHSFGEDTCEVAALFGNLRVTLHQISEVNAATSQYETLAPCANMTLYCVMSGCGDVVAGDCAAQVALGTVILVPSGVAVSLRVPFASKAALNVSRIELVANFGPGFGFFEMLSRPIFDHNQARFAQSSMSELFDELSTARSGARPIAEALLAILLIRIVRSSIGDERADDPIRMILTQPEIARVLSIIAGNPERRYSVQSLADIARLTPTQLTCKFNQIFGETPSDYLKNVRLKLAEAMLAETSLPVKTIAGNVGFASRSHFSRIFRDHSGLDPTEFRQQKMASL